MRRNSVAFRSNEDTGKITAEEPPAEQILSRITPEGLLCLLQYTYVLNTAALHFIYVYAGWNDDLKNSNTMKDTLRLSVQIHLLRRNESLFSSYIINILTNVLVVCGSTTASAFFLFSLKRLQIQFRKCEFLKYFIYLFVYLFICFWRMDLQPSTHSNKQSTRQRNTKKTVYPDGNSNMLFGLIWYGT